MILAFTLVLAAAAAGPAPVPDPSASGSAVEATPDRGAIAAKDRDPIICERMKEIGSMLITKKVCKRRSEWAQDRRDDRANIERSQSRGMNSN
jgi:hypothetical protein